jgi:hypothetical protein
LCHGENLVDAIERGEDQDHNRRWKSIVTQSFAASDIVHNFRRLSTGAVKAIVSQQMRADSASGPFFDLMGEFGISLSKATVRREEYSKVEETIKAGMDMHNLSRSAIVFQLYDNAGFKGRAESAERSGMINIPRSSGLRSHQKT